MRQDPFLRCILFESESYHSAFCVGVSVACLLNGPVTWNLVKPIALLSLDYKVSIHEHLVNIWVAGLEGCHLEIVYWQLASIFGAASDEPLWTHRANNRQMQCPVPLSCGCAGKEVPLPSHDRKTRTVGHSPFDWMKASYFWNRLLNTADVTTSLWPCEGNFSFRAYMICFTWLRSDSETDSKKHYY